MTYVHKGPVPMVRVYGSLKPQWLTRLCQVESGTTALVPCPGQWTVDLAVAAIRDLVTDPELHALSSDMCAFRPGNTGTDQAGADYAQCLGMDGWLPHQFAEIAKGVVTGHWRQPDQRLRISVKKHRAMAAKRRVYVKQASDMG